MKDEIYFWLRGMSEGLDVAADLLAKNPTQVEKVISSLRETAESKRVEMAERAEETRCAAI